MDPTYKQPIGNPNFAGVSSGGGYSIGQSEPIPVSTLNSSVKAIDVPPPPSQDYSGVVNSAITSSNTPSKTYTTPSGATVDTAGNTITAPVEEVSDFSTYLKKSLGPDFDMSAPTSTVSEYNKLISDPSYVAKQKEVDDLDSQLKALEAEAKQLGIESQAIPIRDQQNSEGLGRTAGGLAPLTAAQQRALTLKSLDLASRTLPVSARKDLALGRLESATNKINQLMDLTYKDQQAQTQWKNMMYERAFAIADKDQQAAIARRKEANDKIALANEELYNLKKTFFDEYAKAGDMKTAIALGGAKTQAEMQKIIESAPKIQTSLPASAQEYEYAVRHGYTGSYTQYQNEDANRKAAIAGATTAGAPTSYKEWELAGKPGTYQQWLKDNNVKAPTVAQQTVAEYAARIEQANPTISRLEDSIKNMNFLAFEAQLKFPPTFQSTDIQQYMQAASNFINAKLRRESGAVISPSEFAEARKQYLPQPGDSPEVLAQKKANRDLVYASLRTAAGNAYQSVDELLGTQNTNDQYTSYRTQLKPGEILIQRNGQIGAISESEFNPKTDTKL